MNRMKKEEIRKYKEKRAGLSEREIEMVDRIEDLEAKLNGIASYLHGRLFKDEFDYMYDEAWDSSQRKKGINPMKAEYVAKYAERRNRLGVVAYEPIKGTAFATEQWVKDKVLEGEIGLLVSELVNHKLD